MVFNCFNFIRKGPHVQPIESSLKRNKVKCGVKLDMQHIYSCEYWNRRRETTEHTVKLQRLAVIQGLPYIGVIPLVLSFSVMHPEFDTQPPFSIIPEHSLFNLLSNLCNLWILVLKTDRPPRRLPKEALSLVTAS